jgi:alkylation response protein AidB-like acyl-CoA dehydrogenase
VGTEGDNGMSRPAPLIHDAQPRETAYVQDASTAWAASSARTDFAALAGWLDAHAEALDTQRSHAADVLPQLARAGVTALGVPETQGGAGGTIGDAIDAVAAVAARSLTAAFVLWGHRTFIEYVLQSDNDALRARWLAPLLRGDIVRAARRCRFAARTR